MPEGTRCALAAEDQAASGRPDFISRAVLADKLDGIQPDVYLTTRLIHVNDGAVLVVISGRVVAEAKTTAEALGILAQACQMLRERL